MHSAPFVDSLVGGWIGVHHDGGGIVLLGAPKLLFILRTYVNVLQLQQ
jgi:hypothetical protein